MIRPYLQLMRLHKPTGIFLVMWPAWWAAALAGATFATHPRLYAIFAIGALVMRSAGCVINDIWDRDIDTQVERTKSRPLASGILTVKHALYLLSALLGIGLALLWQFDWPVRITGFVFAILITLYPLAKRFLAIPQLVLAFAINGGALIAYMAVAGFLTADAWTLYAICFCWTIGYDTIYAHQDARDDAVIGIGSSALLFRHHTKPILLGCYFLVIVGLIWLGHRSDLAGMFHLMMTCVGLQMALQLWWLRTDDATSCANIFTSNTLLGAMIWLTLYGHAT